MKKQIVMNDLLIITSDFTPEEIMLVKQNKPEVLKVYEDDKPVFSMGWNEGDGSISKFGIEFGELSNDGKAALMISMPYNTIDENKKWLADNYAKVISYASVVEAVIEDVLPIIQFEIEEFMDNIEVC